MPISLDWSMHRTRREVDVHSVYVFLCKSLCIYFYARDKGDVALGSVTSREVGSVSIREVEEFSS